MNKSRKLAFTIISILLGLLFIVVIGLFIFETAKNGWIINQDRATKYAIVIIGLLLTLVKLITNGSGSASLHQYEAIYRKEIGSAFSMSNQKKQKRALLVAIAYYHEDKYGDAIKRLQTLLKECHTREERAVVLLFLSLAYADAGTTDDAITTYEELVELVPDHSRAWSNLGIQYQNKGKHSTAVSCFEAAIKYDPNNAYAWNNLAQAYIDTRNWQKVIDAASRAIDIKFDLYQAENALTIAYYALGEHEKSKQHFDSAVLHGANGATLSAFLRNLSQSDITFGDANGVREEVRNALGHLQRDTAIPMVEIALPAPMDGNHSRFGGAPIDTNVPLDSTGKPMKLLAAIWCSEVRGVPDFPDGGVLRFYVADNDLYGADFDHPTLQSDFRVLYDEDEEKFNTVLQDEPSLSKAFPIQHVLPLRLRPTMGSVEASDYQFEKQVNAALRKAGTEGDARTLNDDEFDFLYNHCTHSRHSIGGYPCFEQYDPRENDSKLQKYDTLLLQIVSHTVANQKGNYSALIMFGDEGGCQFFIPQDKLRAHDFSDILYWWDCG